MRIAYVCADPGVPVFGAKGSSVHVQGVVGALLRRGDVSLDLIAMRRGGPVPASLVGARVHELERPSTREPRDRERALAAVGEQVGMVLASIQPDVVYERHALWSATPMTFAQEHGLPGLLEVNAPLVEEQARHRVLVDRAGAEQFAALSMAAASSILAVSADLGHDLSRRPEAAGKVTVVPNGVDLARFPDVVDRPSAPFIVAFVGTLKPWHGLDVLAQAFAGLRAQVRDARLMIIGDGPGREHLGQALDAHGVGDAIEWCGAVAPSDVGELIARADATVAPYPETAETYFSPLKVVEGLASGRPIVASAVGQIPQLLDAGRAGVLCDPTDPGSFAAALVALAHDSERARAIGRAGRARAEEHYTWDAVVERILALATSPLGAAA